MTGFRIQKSSCAVLAISMLLVGLPARASDLNTCYDAKGVTAIDACTRLIESGKYDQLYLSDLYNRRAVALKIEEKYAQALADYNVAISIEPTSEKYSNRANTKRLLKDIDGALDDMQKALEQEPGRAAVFVNRGLIWHFEKQNYDRAIADYDQAIRLDRYHAGAYAYRGQAYEAKGDLLRALSDYRQTESTPIGGYSDDKWTQDFVRDRLRELDKK